MSAGTASLQQRRQVKGARSRSGRILDASEQLRFGRVGISAKIQRYKIDLRRIRSEMVTDQATAVHAIEHFPVYANNVGVFDIKERGCFLCESLRIKFTFAS